MADAQQTDPIPPLAAPSGSATAEWCDAGGQPLGYGAPEKIGDTVACPVCGKHVKLRDQIGRYFTNTPAYPRHKRQSHNHEIVSA